MRKFTAIILALMLVVVFAAQVSAETGTSEIVVPGWRPPSEYQQNRAIDSPFYGRLYIPDVGIDVALYYSLDQDVTDRADSANIFTWRNYPGETIVDHASQEFSKLFDVRLLTKGRIEKENGEIIHIECVDIFDGVNGGTKGILDKNGNSVHGLADYMTYTCIDNRGNIRICLWKKTKVTTNITVTPDDLIVPDVPIKSYISIPDLTNRARENTKIEIPDLTNSVRENVKNTLPADFWSNWFKDHPFRIDLGSIKWGFWHG